MELFELSERFVSLAYSCGSYLQKETIATMQPALAMDLVATTRTAIYGRPALDYVLVHAATASAAAASIAPVTMMRLTALPQRSFHNAFDDASPTPHGRARQAYRASKQGQQPWLVLQNRVTDIVTMLVSVHGS
jgi:hypothetical protein